MAKTLINIRTDVEVKNEAQKVARDMGLPLSTVINAYLRQFIRTKEIHFSVEGELKPSVKKRLDRLMKEARKGKNLSGPFSTADDAIRYLNS